MRGVHITAEVLLQLLPRLLKVRALCNAELTPPSPVELAVPQHKQAAGVLLLHSKEARRCKAQCFAQQSSNTCTLAARPWLGPDHSVLQLQL